MAPFSLYSRMREHGTLAETPGDVPDARFALPSTINWMRSLAILLNELQLNFTSARDAYAKVQKRALNERELNSVCEQLLFALHQLASLRACERLQASRTRRTWRGSGSWLGTTASMARPRR